MKLQPKSYLMGRLLSLIGAAIFLIPLTAQAVGPDLSVTKTCTINGPQSVLCTITVANIGTVPSVAPLSLTDTVTVVPPGTLYTGAGGNLPIGCSAAGPVTSAPITCIAANTSLAPGQSGTILLSFSVPQSGTFTNCATVSQGSNAATPHDPNPANNTNICTTITVGGGPINVITPPPSGRCDNQVVVSGMHYPGPNQNCAQTNTNFVNGLMSNFHLTSQCKSPNSLLGVINATCQNTPIPGFPGPGGSVYQATACCGVVAKSGRLTVLKTVVNTLGVPTPPAFSITAHCTPPSGLPLSTPLSVPANSGVSLATPIIASSTCTVTENLLASIPNVKACRGGSASWVTSYSPPVTIVAGATATLTVTNTLTCDKLASLTVLKQIVNNTGVVTPGPFQVQLNCGPGSNQPVSLTSPSFQQIVNIPSGSTCTITEQPPTAPAGCKWITTYPKQTGTVGDKLVVQNELQCGCPRGQTEMTFPGTDIKYCCDGKPGSDKFCCNRKK